MNRWLMVLSLRPTCLQMGSFFVEQGAYMNRQLALPSGGTFIVPAASLAMINTLAIVILIPLYDTFLVPLMRRVGQPITLLRRMGWGLVVCIAAMGVAAYLEVVRLRLYDQGHVICEDLGGSDAALGANKHCQIVDLSVWWQTPQYLLIGLSEVRGAGGGTLVGGAGEGG